VPIATLSVEVLRRPLESADRARQRCADLPWATLLSGDARSLPAEDASIDVVAIYRS